VDYLTASLLLAGIFAVLNVFARFDYWVEGRRFRASWRILGIIPLLSLSVPLDSVDQVIRFRLMHDGWRYFRPFGRPFSPNGAPIVRSGLHSPIYCSPRSFDHFQEMIISAKASSPSSTSRLPAA
jgi:hypothetical protein